MNETVRSTVKIFKRVFPVLMAVLMLLAFSAQALAASEKSNGSGKSNSETGTEQRGNSSQNQKDKDKKNGATEQTETKEKARYHGISVEKITLAIDSVSDEATKAELTELLEAYTAALEDKDGALAAGTGLSELAQAASDARKALKDGLEEAGFTLGSVLGWQEWKEWPTQTTPNLDRITAVIAALEDSDENKAALTALMTAYQDALTAENSATEENREALEEAAKAARDALLDALFEAGLYPLEELAPTAEEPVEQE